MTINYFHLAYAIAAGQLLYSIANTVISAGLSYIIYLRQRGAVEQQEREMQAMLAHVYGRKAEQDLLDRSIENETVN